MLVKLRRASMEDSEILFRWRNDPVTRNASHNTQEITIEEHEAWLRNILADKDRRIYIAEVDREPVGTVRADYENGVHRLSWTVAPDFRGRGCGKDMVLALLEELKSPVRAEVKADNIASRRIAESAGMELEKEEGGILYFSRKWP